MASGKLIRALSFIVALSAVLGLMAAGVGSLLVAALALGVCLLGAAVLLTRKEPEPEPPVVIEKVVITTPGWCSISA